MLAENLPLKLPQIQTAAETAKPETAEDNNRNNRGNQSRNIRRSKVQDDVAAIAENNRSRNT
jgi:hypothetical protein